jgi:glycosyltransferase involved in cell wall biosynthesis
VNDNPKIAILFPCYNEELTIGKVIVDFRSQLPHAAIYVFDNCCTDRTAEIALEHGAQVVPEARKGKGYVLESMFNDISADLFVLVDGDDTYPAESIHDLLAPVLSGQAAMVVGTRLSRFKEDSFRPMHFFGNQLVLLR